MVLLAKTKLNTIKVLISRCLIGSNITHDESFVVKILLREYCDMKKAI